MGIFDKFRRKEEEQLPNFRSMTLEEVWQFFKKATGANKENAFEYVVKHVPSFEVGIQFIKELYSDNPYKVDLLKRSAGFAQTKEQWEVLYEEARCFAELKDAYRKKVLSLSTDFKSFWQSTYQGQSVDAPDLKRLLELAGSDVINLALVHESAFRHKEKEIAAQCLPQIFIGNRTFDDYYAAYKAILNQGTDSNLKALLLAAMEKKAGSIKEQALVVEFSPPGALVTQKRIEDLLALAVGS